MCIILRLVQFYYRYLYGIFASFAEKRVQVQCNFFLVVIQNHNQIRAWYSGMMIETVLYLSGFFIYFKQISG